MVVPTLFFRVNFMGYPLDGSVKDFCELQLFLFQGLDVRSSGNLCDRFFNWISCNKNLKATISCFFLCFFCLIPLGLECSRIRKTASFPIQGFIQAVLLMSIFWTKIEFSNVVKCSWASQCAVSSVTDS